MKPNLIKVTLLLLYSFAGASYLVKFTCFKPKRNEVATADHFLEEQLQWSPRAVACQVFLSGEIPLPMATARPLFVLYIYIGGLHLVLAVQSIPNVPFQKTVSLHSFRVFHPNPFQSFSTDLHEEFSKEFCSIWIRFGSITTGFKSDRTMSNIYHATQLMMTSEALVLLLQARYSILQLT